MIVYLVFLQSMIPFTNYILEILCLSIRRVNIGRRVWKDWNQGSESVVFRPFMYKIMSNISSN